MIEREAEEGKRCYDCDGRAWKSVPYRAAPRSQDVGKHPQCAPLSIIQPRVDTLAVWPGGEVNRPPQAVLPPGTKGHSVSEVVFPEEAFNTCNCSVCVVRHTGGIPSIKGLLHQSNTALEINCIKPASLSDDIAVTSSKQLQ